MLTDLHYLRFEELDGFFRAYGRVKSAPREPGRLVELLREHGPKVKEAVEGKAFETVAELRGVVEGDSILESIGNLQEYQQLTQAARNQFDSLVRSKPGLGSYFLGESGRLLLWNRLFEANAHPDILADIEAIDYMTNPRIDHVRIRVEEILGGHSIERHGSHIPLIEMEQRVLGTHPTMPQSRSALKFKSHEIHVDAVNEAYKHFKDEIELHFAQGGDYFTTEPFDYGVEVGDGYHNYSTRSNPTSTYVKTKKLQIAFRADPQHPDGYMLDSAYPKFEP